MILVMLISLKKNKDVIFNIVSTEENNKKNKQKIRKQMVISLKKISLEIKNYQEQKLSYPYIMNNSLERIHYTIPMDFSKE